MELNKGKYGLLLTPDITLHRKYFKEMVRLLGIQVIYRAPRPGKHYTNFTEIESNYFPPETIGCIFEEHPDQKTMKKLGWVSEEQEEASIIHVAYDTKDIQAGALFIVPSGIDCAKGRLFRVVEMKVGIIYPASISCKIIPEWENDYSPDQNNFKTRSFTLLNTEEMDNI